MVRAPARPPPTAVRYAQARRRAPRRVCVVGVAWGAPAGLLGRVGGSSRQPRAPRQRSDRSVPISNGSVARRVRGSSRSRVGPPRTAGRPAAPASESPEPRVVGIREQAVLERRGVGEQVDSSRPERCDRSSELPAAPITGSAPPGFDHEPAPALSTTSTPSVSRSGTSGSGMSRPSRSSRASRRSARQPGARLAASRDQPSTGDHEAAQCVDVALQHEVGSSITTVRGGRASPGRGEAESRDGVAAAVSRSAYPARPSADVAYEDDVGPLDAGVSSSMTAATISTARTAIPAHPQPPLDPRAHGRRSPMSLTRGLTRSDPRSAPLSTPPRPPSRPTRLRARRRTRSARTCRQIVELWRAQPSRDVGRQQRRPVLDRLCRHPAPAARRESAAVPRRRTPRGPPPPGVALERVGASRPRPMGPASPVPASPGPAGGSSGGRRRR